MIEVQAAREGDGGMGESAWAAAAQAVGSSRGDKRPADVRNGEGVRSRRPGDGRAKGTQVEGVSIGKEQLLAGMGNHNKLT